LRLYNKDNVIVVKGINMNTAAIYARVSTDEQKKHGISLDAQVAKCVDYAKMLGLEVIETAVEGLSGKNTDRPELQKVVSLVTKKRIAHILVVKLDRLSRETEDAIRMAKSFAKKGVTLHLITEGGPVDLSDPSQEMMFTMRAAFGTFERKRIAMNTKFALARKRDLGKRVSRLAPYGYTFNGDKVVENPVEQATIAKIRELKAEGFGETAISRKLFELGYTSRTGRPISRMTIWRLAKAA
jgi:site-specific DNA recombinase